MPNLTADLAYWITERYAIKLRREANQPKPWSPDPIFQSVRFCNVHREDDKVTRWIRKNWNRSYDPVWKFVLGRMLNLPESLDSLLPWGHPEVMKGVLIQKRADGHKIFTSAYTISTCGKSMDKLDYVFDWVVERTKGINEIAFRKNRSLAQAHIELTQIDGLGSFLSAQVLADMKNTYEHPLSTATDFWTWSAPGPGSLRGLAWYFLNGPEGISASTYAPHLRTCRKEVDPLIPGYIPRISDQDFQNCLCEFSKYMKVKKNSNTHIRNKYSGRN